MKDPNSANLSYIESIKFIHLYITSRVSFIDKTTEQRDSPYESSHVPKAIINLCSYIIHLLLHFCTNIISQLYNMNKKYSFYQFILSYFSNKIIY